MFKQFDIVQIINIENVSYLSAPPNSPTRPQGEWSIVGFKQGEAILSKDYTIIKIPVKDIRKIGGYNIPNIIKKEKEHGKIQEEG